MKIPEIAIKSVLQEFFGVPLEGDVGREAYQLVCADSQGLMAIDGIEVHVVGRPFDERFNFFLYESAFMLLRKQTQTLGDKFRMGSVAIL